MSDEVLCDFESRDGLLVCKRRGCRRSMPDRGAPVRARCREQGHAAEAAESAECLHRGEVARVETCQGCSGRFELPVYACAVHGECTLENHQYRNASLAGVHVCRGCPNKKAAEPEGPGALKRAANYAAAQLRDRMNGRRRRSAELVARIFDRHCRVCPHFNSEQSACTKCGCPVLPYEPERNKLAWANESCPAGKWPIQTANLIFYLLPLKHPDNVWPWHVEQLRRRLHLFNGRRIVWIATRGPKEHLALEPPEKVKAAFCEDADSIEFFEAPNDPHHWETPAFRVMLRALAYRIPVAEAARLGNEPPGLPAFALADEASFYFHAKGVRRAKQAAIRPWCEAIYHHNLDRFDEVREILSVWPCCGIARQGTNPTTMGGDGWHFAGTGFWFNHGALFSQDDRWDTIHDHSHAVEAYLATQFPYQASYCLAHDNAGGRFGGVYDAQTWIDWRRVDRQSELGDRAARRTTPGDLRLLILGHDRERLKYAAELPHAHKILLGDLDPRNDQAESRLFHWPGLEAALDRQYVALCTDRWDAKYRDVAPPLAELDRLQPRPDVVWAAQTTPANWILDSEESHPGMADVLWSLIDRLGLTDAQLRRPSLWSNNFMAHRNVVLDLAEFHRRLLPYVIERWGWRPPYDTSKQEPARHLSYLTERFTVLYFCARGDLVVRQMELLSPWRSPC